MEGRLGARWTPPHLQVRGVCRCHRSAVNIGPESRRSERENRRWITGGRKPLRRLSGRVAGTMMRTAVSSMMPEASAGASALVTALVQEVVHGALRGLLSRSGALVTE